MSKSRMSVVDRCFDAALTAVAGEGRPDELVNRTRRVAAAPGGARAGVTVAPGSGARAGVAVAPGSGGRAGVAVASGDGAATGGAVIVGAGGTVAGAANEPRRFYMTREHHPENGTLFGFWLYLMSDCLVFACLFAAYAVLGRSYAGGPTGAELFDLPLVAVNTSLLLLSSITYGFAMLEMQRGRLPGTLVWLSITGLLGAGFIGIELTEFAHLIHEGAGPQRSAFLSSFFTLVATHGLHVTFGIVWLITLMVQSAKHGLIPENRRRLICLSMFWHFLDVVWIGVFTFVYLMGVLP
jgi:cytochrome o ubiquinol oxidase subunit III